MCSSGPQLLIPLKTGSGLNALAFNNGLLFRQTWYIDYSLREIPSQIIDEKEAQM